ncbi:MAG: xylulokinase [Phycisphaerales bacterium]|nr:xylulokinase [Phycisphaerales bacterium]
MHGKALDGDHAFAAEFRGQTLWILNFREIPMSFLGIDVGTSATKVLVLNANGTIAGTAESPHDLLTPKPGWTEQRPEQWWAASVKAARAALKKARVRADQVHAIGLSGQMHGSVFLDKNGKVLRPALLWNDQRTAEQCAKIERLAGGRSELIAMVSNPALTGFTAPKILWLREYEPKKFERCKHVLLPKDYIRYRLTHDYVSEVSDASGTLLLDVKNRTWHAKLLSRLQLDPDLLPALVESQHITGELSDEAAGELGLKAGIPVVGGAGDQAAGAVGTGVVLPGLVSASMGTSGVIFATSGQPQTDPFGRVHTMCHAIPDTWCVFGCMLSAGGSLQWLRNTLFASEMARAKRGWDPGTLYPQMIEEAQIASPGSENLLFLPYLTGERCPHADPHATAAFVGLTARHARRHLIRACLEGITFGMREQIQIFRELQIPISQVRASGGGARSEFWRQLQADMYNAPVVTINVHEGAALGAAILAAVGAGHFNSVPEAAKALIAIQTRSTPNKKLAAFYADYYKKYAALYPTLKPTFNV